MCTAMNFLCVQLLFVTYLRYADSYYHQPTFLEPVFDKYGNEITPDRVLEMTALKSTSLGKGLGWNYNDFLFNQGPLVPPMVPDYIRAAAARRHSHLRPAQASASQSSSLPYGRSSSSINQETSLNDTTLAVSPIFGNSSGLFAPFSHRRFKRQIRDIFSDNSYGSSGFFSLLNDPAFINPSRKKKQEPPKKTLRPPMFYGFPPPFFHEPNKGFTPKVPPRETGKKEFKAPRKKPNACEPAQVIKCNPKAKYRTVDGVCNNLIHPKWGAAKQPMIRMHKYSRYHDGLDVPRMTMKSDRARLLPSPRLVSRLILEPDKVEKMIPELTNLVQQYGQFLDHDITGTPAHKAPDGKELACCKNVYLSEERQVHNDAFNGGECNPIYIPPLDRHFQKSCMSFARSQPFPRPQDCNPGAKKKVREQMNMLTAYIDGSMIYGSTLKDNENIRVFKKGMMKVTTDNMLPEDKKSICVKEQRKDYCFQTGESRVNEHPALATMHTVLHRFHNVMARDMAIINPRYSDEKIFQEVRKIMGAVLQHITYYDWLPIVLGDEVMRSYALTVSGAQERPRYNYVYDSGTNPTIYNSFATAAFRFGHTLIPSLYTVGNKKIRLHRMFNRPKYLLERGSVEKFCSGLMKDTVKKPDRYISTDLSDHLFEDKDNVSMDLAALNIQRGRDHGLPTYNEYREICGYKPIESFDKLYLKDPDRVEVMRRAYEYMDDVDLFVGGITERPLQGALVGETFACILGRQFRNLKFGDRFWYETGDMKTGFTDGQLREIKKMSMSKIFCMAAPMDDIVVNPFYSKDSFLKKPIMLKSGETVSRNRYVSCKNLPYIDLRYWADR